jgi:excisionase family DNA binding protein
MTLEHSEWLLSLNEFAESLRLSPHTIRYLVRTGRITPIRICRRLLFSRDELNRLILSGVQKKIQ